MFVQIQAVQARLANMPSDREGVSDYAREAGGRVLDGFSTGGGKSRRRQQRYARRGSEAGGSRRATRVAARACRPERARSRRDDRPPLGGAARRCRNSGFAARGRRECESSQPVRYHAVDRGLHERKRGHRRKDPRRRCRSQHGLSRGRDRADDSCPDGEERRGQGVAGPRRPGERKGTVARADGLDVGGRREPCIDREGARRCRSRPQDTIERWIHRVAVCGAGRCH